MKKIKFYTLILVALISMANLAFGQATLSIQGIIRKSNGSAVDDGKYDLTFKLYNATTGGTAVHTETQNVSVVGGIYSAELGGSATPLNAAFDQTYFLGVSVDGGAELIPRARLTSSPYALSLLGTTNLFPGSGAVGAGTITPASGYQMHINSAASAGKLLVEGSTAAQIDFKKGSTASSIGFGTTNNDFIVNPGANNTTLQHNGTTKLTVNTNGVDVSGTLSTTTLNVASDLSLTAGKTVEYNGLKDWRLVDVDDFESGNEGWNAYITLANQNSVAPEVIALSGQVNTGNGLTIPNISSWGNGTLKKVINLAGIPHTKVKIKFTYHFTGNPDNELGFAGFAPSLNSTAFEFRWFDYCPQNWGIQGYTNYNSGRSVAFLGETHEFVVTNSANSFVLFVGGQFNEGPATESFVIDDVEVWVK